MNVLILGYGLEGKSVENFFKSDSMLFEHTKIDVLSDFKKEELLFKDFSSYDLIFRSPSLPPKFINAPAEKITSATKYFFHACPCPIIGVTGTKGKGTTCTMIKNILDELPPASCPLQLSTSGEVGSFAEDPELRRGRARDTRDGGMSRRASAKRQRPQRAHLVGNIGNPALDILPDLTETDLVVYELSSFQLWDLDLSPSVSVVLRIEPDHLDVHDSFDEYLSSKQNIVNFQSPSDFCVYFKDNENTARLVSSALSKKLPYPLTPTSENPESSVSRPPLLDDLLSELSVPGAHNKENAEAALLACFALFKKSDPSLRFADFLEAHAPEVRSALKNFQPLPHHLEFVRELNDVRYYDDSFSTVSPALEAALNSFPDAPFVLIAGGKDKGFDLSPVKRLIFDHPHLIKAVLIGETAEKLKSGEDPEKFFDAGTDFELAVSTARALAEKKLTEEEMNSDTCLIDAKKPVLSPVVLLSPCASSFDMFNSYKERGDIFKQIVNSFN